MDNLMSFLAIAVFFVLLVVNVQFTLFYWLKGRWITALFFLAIAMGLFSGLVGLL
jgi:hypothetical protein